MPHALNDDFFRDLNGGRLGWIVKRVMEDHTLCLELRGTSINIYYRGGSLLKVSCANGNLTIPYKAYFDPKYGRGRPRIKLPATLFDARAWDSVLPILKDTMDLWFGKHPKPEREFQQLVLRENNLQQPLANSTDYFFIDIEYAVGKTRFDLVGVRWPSSGPERKIRDGWPLVLVEMKYGDNAHRGLSNGGVPSGGSGLVAHMDNMIKFIQDRDRFKDFKDDILVVYGQKHQLGLIDSKHPINSFSDKPEIMFLLANHDPEKTALREELCRMQEILPAEIPADDVRFFRSSLLGYALYQDNLMTLPDMIDALRR